MTAATIYFCIFCLLAIWLPSCSPKTIAFFCYGKGRPPFCQPTQGFLNQVLAFRVQAGRGFVQNQQPGIAQDCPGNGNSLPFAARQIVAVLTHIGIVTVRCLADKVVGICHLRRLDYLLIGGILFCKTDIVEDCPGKQEILL